MAGDAPESVTVTVRFNFRLWRRILLENRQKVLDEYRTEKGRRINEHRLAYMIGHNKPPKWFPLVQVATICGVTDVNEFKEEPGGRGKP